MWFWEDPPPDEFLQPFIDEWSGLKERGLEFNGVTYAMSLKAVICNAPARAYVKAVKGPNNAFRCEKCAMEGEHKGRRIFPDLECALRSDESFSTLSQEGHHTGMSPFTKISMPMVSGFPLGYMHMVCL